jgi:hypothetical protein
MILIKDIIIEELGIKNQNLLDRIKIMHQMNKKNYKIYHI